MNSREIIESLTKDLRFKSICKQIAKRPHMADELYQEFFLTLCEIKDDRLVEAHNGGYLEVYCVGVINNLWKHRGRVKRNVDGKTSSLNESQHTPLITFGTNLNKGGGAIEERNFDRSYRSGYCFEEHVPTQEPEENRIEEILSQTSDVQNLVREIVDRAKHCSDRDLRFRARVFDYSTNWYKNPRQFSKASGIPAHVCWRAMNHFKKYLQDKINDVHLNRAS